jgi:integrase
MARTVKEARLQERTARAKLAVRHHPYWRTISEGLHIGYYRGVRSGRWIARYRQPGTQDPYQTITLGSADDFTVADGETVLSWKQALDSAGNWFEKIERGESTVMTSATVEDVVKAYIAMRDERDTVRAGRPKRSDASYRLSSYVINDNCLGKTKLVDLTEADLSGWIHRLTELKSTTKRRLVNDLKAALNACYFDYRRVVAADFPLVIKFGLRMTQDALADTVPIARDNQILSDDQVRTIIAEARKLEGNSDFGRLVAVLAATGARFSQLCRMCVRDVQADRGRLMVPMSRKGKKAAGHIRIQVGADVLSLLHSVTWGRASDAPLFERWRHFQVGPGKWERRDRGPWTSSAEMTRPWNKLVADLKMPGIIPYALRHSSIVRGIRVGLPIRLVAALHDTSVAMIERHYSRWITEGLDELAAKAIVPLVSATSPTNLQKIVRRPTMIADSQCNVADFPQAQMSNAQA